VRGGTAAAAMGCSGSKGSGGSSLTGNTIQPYRGVSFQGSSFSFQAEIPVKDRKDPEKRRARLMASQKKSAKLYKSQSWAAPSTKAAPAGHQLMSAQQLRDKGAQREKGLSKSWSSSPAGKHGPTEPSTPVRRRPKHAPPPLSLPLGECSGELGNFWGKSPHSPQELEVIEITQQRDLAHVGCNHSPISPVAIINAKKAAKHLRTNQKTRMSAAEKKKRKKEKLLQERSFMENMLSQEGETLGDTQGEAAGEGENASASGSSPTGSASRSPTRRLSPQHKPGKKLAAKATGGG
jgi:hypothetical protein